MACEKSTFVGRKIHARDGANHLAEVLIRAWPSTEETRVDFTPAALDDLRTAFKDDFDHQKHNVQAILAAHMDSAAHSISGMPDIDGTTFGGEVLHVRVEGATADRKLFGFLLSSAAAAAFGQFFEAWYMRHHQGFGD